MRARHIVLAMAVLALAFGTLAAQAPGWQWVSDPLQKRQQTESVQAACDNYGNTFCSGRVTDLAVFGGEMLDLDESYQYIWKLDSAGNTMWVKDFNYPSTVIRAMDTDAAGNLYVLVWYYEHLVIEGTVLSSGIDHFVAKINPAGDFVWLNEAGGLVANNTLMRVTPSGECYVAGDFSGTIEVNGQYISTSNRDVVVAKVNTTGTWVWATRAFSNGEDWVRALDVDSGGNCYIGGTGHGVLTFGSITIPFIGYMSTVYMAKCSPTGNWAYAQRVYPDQPTYQSGDVYDIAAGTSGMCYLTYYEYDPVFTFHLLAFNSAGESTELYSGPGVWGAGLDCDAIGNIYLYCGHGSGVSFGGYTFDSYQGTAFVKFQPGGNVLWAVQPSIHRYDSGVFRVAPNGNFSLALNVCTNGVFAGYQCCPSWGFSTIAFRMDASGQTLWMRTNWLNSIRSEVRGLHSQIEAGGTSPFIYTTGVYEGGYFIGNQWLPNRGSGTDIYVAKIDAGNNWMWATSAGGSGIDEVWDLVSTGQHIYICGSFSGTATFGTHTIFSMGDTDAFIAKLDTNGNWLWATRCGGGGRDEARDLYLWQNAWPCIAGTFTGHAQFGPEWWDSEGGEDAFVSIVHDNGNFERTEVRGGPFNDSGKAIFVTDNHIYLAGEFRGTAYFGYGELNSVGDSDIFIARVNPYFLWTDCLRAGGLGSDVLNAMWVDEQQNMHVTGSFSQTADFGETTLNSQGGADVFVAKAGHQFSWVWASAGGSLQDDSAASIAPGAPDEVFITGWTSGTSTFGQYGYSGIDGKDIMLAGLDTGTGAWLWAKHSGSYGDDYGTVVANAGGTMLTGGYHGHGADFQSFTLPACGYGQSYFGAISHAVANDDPAQAPGLSLIAGIWPNPFNPLTNIRLSLPSAGLAQLDIYNLRGQKVRALLRQDLPAGEHSAVWDGTDDAGRPVASGLYFAVAHSGGGTSTRKLMLMK